MEAIESGVSGAASPTLGVAGSEVPAPLGVEGFGCGVPAPLVRTEVGAGVRAMLASDVALAGVATGRPTAAGALEAVGQSFGSVLGVVAPWCVGLAAT